MHMRKKKWAQPELDKCPWYSEFPEENRGSWQSRFPLPQPLHMEVGCGKGVSTARMIAENRDINYIAMDISSDVLGDARRNLVRAFREEEPRNVQLVKCDVSYISHFFAPEDQICRLYIHFCNPWPRPKHHKRRLTHPRQLLQYREFLAPGAEIWFKTDDDGLFADSLEYFAACGFECLEKTEDLHANLTHPNYVSEHEEKFSREGIPIKAAIFRMLPDYPDSPFLRKCLRQKEDEEAGNPGEDEEFNE